MLRPSVFRRHRAIHSEIIFYASTAAHELEHAVTRRTTYGGMKPTTHPVKVIVTDGSLPAGTMVMSPAASMTTALAIGSRSVAPGVIARALRPKLCAVCVLPFHSGEAMTYLPLYCPGNNEPQRHHKHHGQYPCRCRACLWLEVECCDEESGEEDDDYRGGWHLFAAGFV